MLSPNDEFAAFELWDKGNLDGSVAKKPDMLEFEYARSGLKNGLKLEQELGTNPYKFGLIGSSDAHTGLAAMEEDNFFGKTTPQEPSPHRLTATFVNNDKTGVKIMDWEVGSSGYAAVWAKENTRASLWDAMQRKETYATTGPRMMVRFFGGWDFDAKDAENRLPAAVGYGKGVPMGGDLSNAPQGKAPTFLIAALKDPIGANLDRYQIVKGWLDQGRQAAKRKSMTSPGRATASPAPTARCRRSATPSIWPTPLRRCLRPGQLLAHQPMQQVDRLERAHHHLEMGDELAVIAEADDVDAVDGDAFDRGLEFEDDAVLALPFADEVEAGPAQHLFCADQIFEGDVAATLRRMHDGAFENRVGMKGFP